MGWFLIALFVLGTFFILPVEAQYWLASKIPLLWETHYGRTFLVGFIAGSIPALFWIQVGWNGLARKLHREDLMRADAQWKGRQWNRER